VENAVATRPANAARESHGENGVAKLWLFAAMIPAPHHVVIGP
jgi:hypothetical protein